MRRLLLGVVVAACSVSFAAAQNKPAKPSPEAMADYRKKMQECSAARAKHEAVAVPYWTRIAEKRKVRMAKRRAGEPVTLDDYVLEQPPVYAGRPVRAIRRSVRRINRRTSRSCRRSRTSCRMRGRCSASSRSR